jgi:CelD/BcsL family acetyltransferase involved in cellulose biosynthesis
VLAERRPLRTLTAEDFRAWRDLAARALEPNPFFEPAFLLPAWRHIEGGAVALLVVRDGERWLACLPVKRAAKFRKVPGPALLTWLHTHCFLGTPLVDRDCPTEALSAALENAATDPAAGYLVLELLADDGPVAAALHEALQHEGLKAIRYERAERAALHRREDLDYLGLKPKRRRELQRQRRALEQEVGPLAVRDRASDQVAIEAFLELEAAGWKGEAGTALTSAGHRLFFGEMCRTFAADGRLQLLSLEDENGRIVAMKCNLLAGDGVFCFKIARDEALGRHSPGVQLELEFVETFHATSAAAWADSCAAEDNQMINRLWRDRRAVATVLVPGRHALGGASRVAIRAALRARAVLRSRDDTTTAD